MGLIFNQKVRFDVKAFREKWGITQLQLSRRTGIAIETISAWENGRSVPNRTSFRLLRAAEKVFIRREKRLAKEAKRREKKEKEITQTDQ